VTVLDQIATRWQYTHGVSDHALVSPDGSALDNFYLARPGAEAFKRDIPNADVRFFDTGPFALETHAEPIAAAIREFLK